MLMPLSPQVVVVSLLFPLCFFFIFVRLSLISFLIISLTLCSFSFQALVNQDMLKCPTTLDSFLKPLRSDIHVDSCEKAPLIWSKLCTSAECTRSWTHLISLSHSYSRVVKNRVRGRQEKRRSWSHQRVKIKASSSSHCSTSGYILIQLNMTLKTEQN